ncbi:hypothetical protein C8R45DRAFT_1222087, partial [Mycena sanguinolenta]
MSLTLDQQNTAAAMALKLFDLEIEAEEHRAIIAEIQPRLEKLSTGRSHICTATNIFDFIPQLGISTTTELVPLVNYDVDDDAPEIPMVLPARDLTFADIANARRVKVTPTEIDTYRTDPISLRNLTFVSLGLNGECLLYLALVGEGPEAIRYEHEYDLEMLADSYQ